jgi:hypothetical protein
MPLSPEDLFPNAVAASEITATGFIERRRRVEIFDVEVRVVIEAGTVFVREFWTGTGSRVLDLTPDQAVHVGRLLIAAGTSLGGSPGGAASDPDPFERPAEAVHRSWPVTPELAARLSPGSSRPQSSPAPADPAPPATSKSASEPCEAGHAAELLRGELVVEDTRVSWSVRAAAAGLELHLVSRRALPEGCLVLAPRSGATALLSDLSQIGVRARELLGECFRPLSAAR